VRQKRSHSDLVRNALSLLVLEQALLIVLGPISMSAQTREGSHTTIVDSLLRNLSTVRGYPSMMKIESPYVSFLEGSLGVYRSASIEGQYNGMSWPYDYSARAGVAVSDGMLPHQADRAIDGRMGGGYIIGDGYGLFSGGHMGAAIGFQQTDYPSISGSRSSKRRISQWDALMTGTNTYHGLTYTSSGRYRVLDDEGDEPGGERALETALAVTRRWGAWSLGSELALDLTYLTGVSISYGRIDGTVGYSVTGVRVEVGGAFSIGENLTEPTTVRIAPVGLVHLQPFDWISLDGRIEGGVEPVSMEKLLRENPHLSLRSDVRHEEGERYTVGCSLTPSRSFRLDALASRYQYNSRLYYTSSTEGRFGVRYASAQSDQVGGRIQWKVGAQNKATMLVNFQETRLENDRRIPYVPRWNAALTYERQLGRFPGTIKGGIQYVGPRPTEQGVNMDPVVGVSMEGIYNPTSKLAVILRVDNLADNTYELWEGYVERGLFGSIGIALHL